jgi:hypothetical protein
VFGGAASTKQNQGVASVWAWQSLFVHHTVLFESLETTIQALELQAQDCIDSK